MKSYFWGDPNEVANTHFISQNKEHQILNLEINISLLIQNDITIRIMSYESFFKFLKSNLLY